MSIIEYSLDYKKILLRECDVFVLPLSIFLVAKYLIYANVITYTNTKFTKCKKKKQKFFRIVNLHIRCQFALIQRFLVPDELYLISLMISSRSFGDSTGGLLNFPRLSLW